MKTCALNILILTKFYLCMRERVQNWRIKARSQRRKSGGKMTALWGNLWLQGDTCAGLAKALMTAGTRFSMSLLPIAAEAEVKALTAAFFTCNIDAAGSGGLHR